MDRPIYILHIIVNSTDYFSQKTCSICVNDFIESYVGHFESGKFVSDELDSEVVYHRQQLLDGYMPPIILIDLVRWMQDMGWWVPWMGEFDQIAIVKRHIDGM